MLVGGGGGSNIVLVGGGGGSNISLSWNVSYVGLLYDALISDYK